MTNSLVRTGLIIDAMRPYDFVLLHGKSYEVDHWPLALKWCSEQDQPNKDVIELIVDGIIYIHINKENKVFIGAVGSNREPREIPCTLTPQPMSRFIEIDETLDAFLNYCEDHYSELETVGEKC